MTEILMKSPPAALFTLVTDRWTQPFWDAAREHRLVAPQCAHCGDFRMPPTPFCPHCQSQEVAWVTLSGQGLLYSYSVVVKAIVPEMEACLPYVTAVVELPDAGGVRLVTNVIGSPLSAIHIGAMLRVTFEEVSEGVVVPRFVVDAAGTGTGTGT